MNLWNLYLKKAEKFGIGDDLIYVAFRGDVYACQSLIEKLKSLPSTERWREGLIDYLFNNIEYGFGDRGREAEILKILIDFPSDYVRLGAFYSLAQRGDKSVLPYLQEMSTHEDISIAIGVQQAIKMLSSNSSKHQK